MIIGLLLAISAIAPQSDEKSTVATGSHAALTKYVKAAQKCGFPGSKIETAASGVEYVADTQPKAGTDPQEADACIMAWEIDHQGTPIYSIDAPPK